MFYKTIIVFFVLSSLIGFCPQRIEAEPQIILTPQESISLYAQKYGAVEKELMTVAKCESGFKPSAIHYHDGGKGKHSVGIFQYQESTFNGFAKVMGEELDYYSYNDQAKLTSWIFANHPELKSHWSCYNKFY